jgi:uncharacterized repeat protein (TIGR03806 family)
MRHLVRLLLIVPLLLALRPVPAATFSQPGFSETQVVTGLDPTTMAFAPDGRLFVCEKPGRLRLVTWTGTAYLMSTVLDLSANVTANNERGLMSVAVDPLWGAGSDYVYLYYTATLPTVHNRLSRFPVINGTALLTDEEVLMDFDTLSGAVHNGGGLRFGQDGKLYVGTGEGGSSANSQNPGSLLGKLLRLNKDGSIPTDNPNHGIYTGDLRAIVALGLRNPYTLAAQAGTNRLYVNDVGGGGWEEINSYTTGTSPAAVNYGWDLIEGRIAAQTPPSGYADPVHVYDHGVGTAICGSAFYQPGAPTGVAFPAAYHGRYFFADYGDYAADTGEIYWIDPENPLTRTLFASAVNRPIALEVAPDGALWYVARGGIVNGAPGSPDDNGSVGTGGSLYRVTWTGGGSPTRVGFVQQPGDTNASTTIVPPVTVAVRDADDAIVNSTATVTVSLGTNPGGGTLSGTLAVMAVDGIATFSDLRIDQPAVGYTLHAASTGLGSATSAPFTVLPTVATPVITPGTGSFSGPVWVQITSATPGAQIRYTTDDSAPTGVSMLYSGAFPLGSTTTVRAIALKTGLDTSAEAGATMTITGTTPYGWPTRPSVGSTAMPATGTGTLPGTLAATNLFSDLTDLTAASGFVPYSVNSPLWSDGAHKRRWVGLPGNSRIGFASTGEFAWPAGTVFIKHFELETNEVTHLKRRLETRVLVVGSTGDTGYGVTYRWNDAGTQASLVEADGLDETFTITTATGTRSQTWRYPSRSQCLQCHTRQAGFVLGPKARQLNGEYTYPGGGTDNQLRTWNYLRMFTTDIGEGAISSLPRMVHIDDGSATLERRVRSYLDANCAHCHRPGGAPSQWDGRYDTDLDAQGIVRGALTNDLGDSEARVVVPKNTARSALHVRLTSHAAGVQMPPLARNLVDQAAMAAIAQWISSLPDGSGLQGDYRNEPKNSAFTTAPALTRTDGPVAFNWGVGSPGSGVDVDNFTVRWSGSLVPRVSGEHTFFVTSDDGARLWVDGMPVIDQWVDQAATETPGTPLLLTAGVRYDVTLESYEFAGIAEIALRWQADGQPKNLVPAYRLFPVAAASVGPVPGTPSAPQITGNGTTSPTISGTGVAGTTIRILVDGVEVGSTTVAGDGTWTYVLTGLLPGTHQVTTIASAPGGDSGASPAATLDIPGTGGGGSPRADGGSSSCGLGGGLAACGLFLLIWLIRPLRLRHGGR